ncbi:tetratricopeptide repeat protein [Bacillus sp. AFS015802]|uniref:tetratricopeptide repeat protein n=1 Tax=Bacillus sp. AFS015802 TaxID=2033486 RepID=UPI0015CF087C|nr:tetratricopeptide repeat protein [Bacillus sp. AFS015802]
MENLKDIYSTLFSSNEPHVSLINGDPTEVLPHMGQLKESFLLDKHYVYSTSGVCLPTESFYIAKQLVYQQLEKLDLGQSSLVSKYKKPLYYLMPWLKEESELFKGVSLGLEIPQEQNPTSFTLSFVYQIINGIINFLLESAKLLGTTEKVVFMFSDIDNTDFSSIRFIEQLAKRSKQANFYLVGSYSANSLPEKYLFLSSIKAKNLADIQSEYASETLDFTDTFHSNRDSRSDYTQHWQKYQEKDLSATYANLLLSNDKSKEIAESFKEAAIYSKRNACYDEAIYYVDILIHHYWDYFNARNKARLLRLKGVSHVLLKQNNIAMECLEESIKHSDDRYFNAKVCYIIGSFITKHIDELLGQEWLDKGFSYIEGLHDKQAVMERLWLNNSRALYYFKNKEYDRAIQIEKDNIKEFQLTFEHNEHLMTHAILHYNTAYALQDRGNFDEALSYMERAIHLVPSHLDLYNNKANMLQIMGRNEEAVHYYEMVKEEGLPKDEVYLNCGNAKSSLGDWGNALKDYDYSLFINPDNSNAWNSRGYLYYLTENNDKAIKDFTQALKVRPQFIPALLNRALTYEAIEQFDHALRDYQTIENLNKNTIEVFVNRASLFQRIGMLNEAKKDLSKAIGLRPNQAEPYVNLAIVHNVEGNFIEAKTLLEKAVTLDKTNPWFYFNKAYIHKVLEEYHEAKKEIENALTLSPNEEEFHNFLLEIIEELNQVNWS